MTHPLATKAPGVSPNLGMFKIDQLAYAAYSDYQVKCIKETLRLENANWVEDVVQAQGYVFGQHGIATNRARLLFNYDLGIELEILQYLDGPNYLSKFEVSGQHIAHIGAHMEPGFDPETFNPTYWPKVQQVETQQHTNPFLVETGRKYRYTIYDTRRVFGHFFKTIERLEATDAS